MDELEQDIAVESDYEAADTNFVDVADPQEESEVEFNEENSVNDEVAPVPPTIPPVKIESAASKQSKEENPKFAKGRRQAELDRVKSEASKQAVLDSIKGIKNTFTGELLEDAEDLADFKAMQKLESEGKDPLADLSGYKRDQRKLQAKERLDEEAKQLENEKNNQELASAIAETNEKYGVDVESLYRTNAEFKAFVDDCSLDSVPIKAMFKLYFKNKESLQQKAETRARDLTLKAKATPGSLSGNTPDTSISPDEYMRLALAGKLD